MTVRTVLLLAVVFAAPSAALADPASEIIKLFGRDPGTDAAHACFVRHYTKAHLASHPRQNVTDMVLYVKKTRDDGFFGLTMQVNFRHLKKPFQVAGGCEEIDDNKHALTCGLDCDGGSIKVEVKNQTSVLVEIPPAARVYDPDTATEDTDPDEDEANLPKGARFAEDDKLFRLDRTALEDCAPAISDQDIRAKVLQGIVTQ